MRFWHLLIVLFITLSATARSHAEINIYQAAAAGDVESLKKLVEQDHIPVDISDQYQRTPLFYAIREGKTRAAAYLLGKKADINKKAKDGKSPLSTAVICNRKESVVLLLKSGADWRARDYSQDGLTPLHYACILGYLDLVKSMVDNGINIEVRDGYNSNPLFSACRTGQMEIARYLIGKKSSFNYVNRVHCSALDMATIGGNRKLIDYLRSIGAKTTSEIYEANKSMHVD